MVCADVIDIVNAILETVMKRNDIMNEYGR